MTRFDFIHISHKNAWLVLYIPFELCMTFVKAIVALLAFP